VGTSCKGIVLDGIEGTLVTLEARPTFDCDPGRVRVIGLPDAAVREGVLRIRSALATVVQGLIFQFPHGVMVNLAPADLKKVGRTLDLALAMVYAGLLLELDADRLRSFVFLGEVGLEGDVRPVAGTLAAAMLARKRRAALVCPAQNLAEALVVEGPDIHPVSHVTEAIDVVRGLLPPCSDPRGIARGTPPDSGIPDLADVRGQYLARRALEIAAAGGHNLLFEGPPGSGKTMLARRMPGILPPLGDEEALECALVHGSVRAIDASRLRVPPFRSPHHTASPIGLAGGGNPIRPGEISLAHRGVLFLDELPEFSREALEVLREPMEERAVNITRAGHVRRLPAHVLVVAARNPCPCGFHGLLDGRCRCTPQQVDRYGARISGPLLDRFDLRVRLKAVTSAELFDGREGETTHAVRERVIAARERQHARTGRRRLLNADLPDSRVWDHARLGPSEIAFYRRLVDSVRLSARGARRLLRVARTIADLEGADRVTEIHLSEAVAFRMPEEKPEPRIV
jgi:magnesium chelatase family protein